MIIANNKSGLGNRMKSIVSAMRLDNDYRVHWTKNKDLTCEFSDLFLNDIEVKTVPTGAKMYPSWRLAVLDTDPIPNGFTKVTADRDMAGNKFSFTCPRLRNIDLEFSRIPPAVRTECVNKFSNLIINPEILEKAEKFSSNFNDETISVHIRSWSDDIERKDSFHRLESFFASVKSNLINTTDGNIYLTSDSDYVKNLFKTRYGNRVLIYDRKTDIATSRFHSEGIKEDFIEMLLLSKNNKIIGTYLSTYTEVAWWLGGAKAEVEIC
jgi:hypothetical protein